jgi:hypothetical protein
MYESKSDRVDEAMQAQSDARKQLESVLAAAHKTVMETGGLPADSTDPKELFQRTLQTIEHNEMVARAYAQVAVQVGTVANASLEVARAVAADLPDLTQVQQEAMQRAEGIVVKLRGGQQAIMQLPL